MLRGLRKAWSIALLLAFLEVWVYGGGSLSAKNLADDARREPTISSLDSRFDGLLADIADVIRDCAAKTKTARDLGFHGIDRLRQLRKSLAEEDSKARTYFSDVESFIGKKQLPAEILARHRDFIREYESKYDALKLRLDAIESAHSDATGFLGKLTGANKRVDWEGVLDRAGTFLEENAPRPPKRSFDPNNLPHRSLRADKPIPPKLTREEWVKAFSAPPSNAAPSKNQADASKAALQSAGAASAPMVSFATAPPTAADLAETIEVKFTPDIRQLADSLCKTPVKIFNWVRNNLEFVPTWGSIQGAQLCLENRAGNAFDTSSLLIALLRYSGIPARYQMGTIEVPIEKFKNWAGGFTNAEAAASLFASAGVPSVVRRVDQSGQVVSVRLEHIWVKTFVDFAPSGGAIHRQSDSWVEVDPSFKQNSFTSGVDLEAVLPLNAQGFLTQLASSATVDPVTGSVTNIDSTRMQSFLQQKVDERVNYLQTNHPNATMRELFGGKAIFAQAHSLLSATLPYRVMARATEMAQVPDSLRHRVTFGLGSDAQFPNGPNLFSYTASLPELAGKNVLLLYAPASPTDDQILRQGQSSWPSSIHLVPQLFVGSQLVASGQQSGLGAFVVSTITFSSPTISTPPVFNTLLVGEGCAVGLDLQGISHVQMRDLGDKAQTLATRLQQSPPQSLTNREFAEAFLSTNVASWFAITDLNDRTSSQSAGVVTLRYPSAGLFLAKLRAASLFGAVVSVSMDGLSMDIDRDVVVSVAKDGDAIKTAKLSFAQGAFGSAMEAEIPSRLLSTASNPVSGVATSQALKLANDQGIPIYNINRANSSLIVPLLQIAPGDLSDIQDAIAAGLEVSVSQRPVNFGGRAVLGTVIRDPVSGSASFLVTGGANGAIILFFLSIMLVILVIGLLAGGPLAAFIALTLAGSVGFAFLLGELLEGGDAAVTDASILLAIVGTMLFLLGAAVAIAPVVGPILLIFGVLFMLILMLGVLIRTT